MRRYPCTPPPRSESLNGLCENRGPPFTREFFPTRSAEMHHREPQFFPPIFSPTPTREHHPCFELFYRNTGGFLFGKPCDTRLSVFCLWLMCIGKHQNCEDVFIRRHRYMNTAFRYSYFDMLLQTLAVSCISAFDGGEPHYKNGYTHPRSSENAVQKCIHAGRSPLF